MQEIVRREENDNTDIKNSIFVKKQEIESTTIYT